MDKKEVVYFMREAILEGKKAFPKCLPNPPIGCVIVKNGRIIARGHTNEPGKDHAEAMALRAVPIEEEDISLFVTLEPCSFQGKTPSCARTISSRKVKAVYVGIIDPHPKNRGAGIEILKKGGIHVEVGILAEIIRKELDAYLIKH